MATSHAGKYTTWEYEIEAVVHDLWHERVQYTCVKLSSLFPARL